MCKEWHQLTSNDGCFRVCLPTGAHTREQCACADLVGPYVAAYPILPAQSPLANSLGVSPQQNEVSDDLMLFLIKICYYVLDLH